MIINSWNIRGFCKPQRRRKALQLCNKEKVDVLCLQEGKIHRKDVKRSLRIFDEEWDWAVSLKQEKTRMLLFWRRSTIEMEISSIEEQLINCRVISKRIGVGCKVSFVYGASQTEERNALWQQLRSAETEEPWLVLGDFNATLRECERRGERSVAEPDQGFVECVRATGCFFTWFNRRSNREAITVKLDRALVNGEWIDQFPDSRAHFAEPLISDHYRIQVRTADQLNTKPKPFRFFNSWTSHDDFKSIVKAVWEERSEGTAMFQVTQKLKMLKVELKKFNREKYLPELRKTLELEEDLKLFRGKS